MVAPAVITVVTGHFETAALAGDLRYLDETTSRGNWQFIPLTPMEIKDLIGKNRRLFVAEPGGRVTRLPAETVMVRGKDGVLRARGTGTISEAYAGSAVQLQATGKVIFQRIVIGIKPISHDHGYPLARPHGTIAPLTWTAQVRAQEQGWTATLPTQEGMSILGRVLRDSTRPHVLVKHTVKTMTSKGKVARTIAGHNLVVAPSPTILTRIKAAKLPVDKVLERGARRALERMERKRGAQIIAVCSTHLQDSSGIRPHLHLRMSAYDSAGKYISLFNRKNGSSSGGRCVMQAEIERETIRTIERWDQPRER